MKSSFPFYSVVGCNAVAVFDSWELVIERKKYIKKMAVKGFDSFFDAEEWALTQFSHYLPRDVDLPVKLPLNFIVFRKHLKFSF